MRAFLEALIWVLAVVVVLRWFHVVSRIGSQVEASIELRAEEFGRDRRRALPCAG